MAMPPRISGSSPVGGSHITYSAVGGVNAAKPVMESVPFTSVQVLDAENLLQQLEQQHQSLLSAVVKRSVSQLESVLISDLLGTESVVAKSSVKLPASTWILVLDVAGKQLLLGSDVPFQPGEQITLRRSAAGKLLIEPSANAIPSGGKQTISAAAPLMSTPLLNSVQTAVDDSLRMALPRQENIALVAGKLQSLLPVFAQHWLTDGDVHAAKASNVEAQVPVLLQKLAAWLQRVPDAAQLLQQPQCLQQQLQHGGSQLEKHLAEIVRSMPTDMPAGEKVAQVAAAMQALQQQDSKVLLLQMLKQFVALKATLPVLDLQHNAVVPEQLGFATMTEKKQVLDVMEKLLQSALSRIVVQQVQSVMDGQSVESLHKHAQQATAVQHWHQDIVLRHGEQFFNVPLHIVREREEGAGSASRPGEFVWQVHLDFDLGELGPMRAVIRASASGTSVLLQTQNPLLAAQIAGKQAELEQRLHKRGIQRVAVNQGHLPVSTQEQSLAQVLMQQHAFIDVHT